MIIGVEKTIDFRLDDRGSMGMHVHQLIGIAYSIARESYGNMTRLYLPGYITKSIFGIAWALAFIYAHKMSPEALHTVVWFDLAVVMKYEAEFIDEF
jgi:hypothetical protein